MRGEHIDGPPKNGLRHGGQNEGWTLCDLGAPLAEQLVGGLFCAVRIGLAFRERNKT